MTHRLVIILLCSFCLMGRPVEGAPSINVVRKPSLTCPQTEIGDADLQARYEKLWKTYADSVVEATDSLVFAIQRQSALAKEAGNLDLAILWGEMQKKISHDGKLEWDTDFWKSEWKKKRFGEAKFPEDFTLAVRKCSVEYDDAKQCLEKSYKALITDLTKADNLDRAVAIREELDELLVKECRTALAGTYWLDGNGGMIAWNVKGIGTLRRDGQQSQVDVVKVMGDRCTMRVANNEEVVFVFSKDFRSCEQRREDEKVQMWRRGQ